MAKNDLMVAFVLLVFFSEFKEWYNYFSFTIFRSLSNGGEMVKKEYNEPEDSRNILEK